MGNIQIARNVERYSIIKLKDGTIGVWERKAKTVIIEWNKYGREISLDTEVEVLKNPCHLAADYLPIAQGKIIPEYHSKEYREYLIGMQEQTG